MRLTGGTARGRRVASPRGGLTRPTSDRIRENLFNILGPLEGARVLDLFCGAGTLGLEALSRGASSAWFVDVQKLPLRALASSVASLGFEERVTVRRLRLPGGLDAIRSHARAFDLVLLDPPYGSLDLEPCLERLGAEGLVAAGGIVVAEHDRSKLPGETHGRLRKVDERRYGRTVLTFFRCNET